jgi:hypothetical protein
VRRGKINSLRRFILDSVRTTKRTRCWHRHGYTAAI